MKVQSLDHVALWVADPDALAEFLTANLGMHVIERTERFTIVGADARRGKLTLFAAESEREPGALARVVLRVNEIERALDALPHDLNLEKGPDGVARFEAPERLALGLVEGDGVDYDLDHVVLLAGAPDRAFAELAELGFDAAERRLWAGDAYLWLEQGSVPEPERPLLNHLGLLVESAAAHLDEARERGVEIADVVDAENTYAVFVWGPDRLKLEYVEHKASFSLV